MEIDSSPIFILVNDGSITSKMDEYWIIVHTVLIGLAKSKIPYNLILVNHDYLNFTERVTTLEKANNLLNMSARGQNHISGKLKDIFYSLNGKGLSRVVVISPDIQDTPELIRNIKTYLPDQTYLNLVNVTGGNVTTQLNKLERVKPIKLSFSMMVRMEKKLLQDYILAIKTSRKPFTHPSNYCCKIC
jgi:hypothetical protein